MRRLVWCALALAAACGTEVKTPSAPLDLIRLPTGLAVLDGRLLVASSNGDLFYDDATGGSLLALDPSDLGSVKIAGAVRVRSFAGDLAVARAQAPGPGVPYAEACGPAADGPVVPIAGPLAFFGTRGSNTLNVVSVGADGSLSCAGPGARCGIGTGPGYTDPLAATVACGGGRARAYAGYLSAPDGIGWVSELELAPPYALRSVAVGYGPVRGFAYDRDRDRLFLTGLALGGPTPLRWIDLAGCTFGLAPGAGGCPIGEATLPSFPTGLELRSIALANPAPGAPRAPGVPIRAYVTARLYDATAAAAAGFRTTDYGGLLIVLDLEDDAFGGVLPVVVASVPIGKGAQDVRVLPRSPTWPPGRRDMVAAMSVDDGVLWIYDDETGALDAFARDERTGAPILGHQPYGLAVDPVPAGTTARVWAGSYRDSYVTPIDVTLDPVLAATNVIGGAVHHLTGATP